MTGVEFKALIPDTATVWIDRCDGEEAYELAAEDLEVDGDGDVMILVSVEESDDEDEDDEPEEETE